MSDIIIPNTYRKLVLFVRSINEHLVNITNEIADPHAGQGETEQSQHVMSIDVARSSLQLLKDVVGYLEEQIPSQSVKTSLSLVEQEHGFARLDAYQPGENGGQLIKEGLVKTAQAALQLRAPLSDETAGIFTSHVLNGFHAMAARSLQGKGKKAADALIEALVGTATGGDVPFHTILSHQAGLEQYGRGATGWGGGQTGPSDDEINTAVSAYIGLGNAMMQAAESRLSPTSEADPVPVKPASKTSMFTVAQATRT